MKGYWLILGSEITDHDAQAAYSALWAPIAERYKARLLRGDGAPQLLEGRDTARVLLVEFPDITSARACYDDPEYQIAKTTALRASRRDLLIFEGELGAQAAD